MPHIADYIVCGGVLAASLGIGLYHSVKQRSSQEYVHASRKMSLFPAAVSMVVGFISAVSLQGLPAEVYLYGIEISLTVFAIFGISLINITFLPIYYQLQPTSVFEYLERRFHSNGPKLIACLFNMIGMVLYSGIILFGPAVALESLIGLPTVYNLVGMSVICTVYTSLGGIRGVIWTDVFQAGVMVCGMFAIVVFGSMRIDWSQDIWRQMEGYGKTRIDISPNPLQRGSLWIYTVCVAVHKYGAFTSQPAMLRYTSLPSMTQARASVYLSIAIYLVLQVLSLGVGVIVLIYYIQQGCGPIAEGHSPNQVIPVFVLEVLSYPGIPGLFVSAIVASTLSSVSSAQQAATAVFWRDIVNHCWPGTASLSEGKKTLLLKLIALMFGLMMLLVGFLSMYAGGTLFQLSYTTLSVLLGPMLGMFVISALTPRISFSTAIVGCTVSSLTCITLAIGSTIVGTIWEKPVLIDHHCTAVYHNYTAGVSTGVPLQSTALEDILTPHNDSWFVTEPISSGYNWTHIFSISSYAYPLLGSVLTAVISLVLSLCPPLTNTTPVDQRLLFPFVRALHKGRTLEINSGLSNDHNINGNSDSVGQYKKNLDKTFQNIKESGEENSLLANRDKTDKKANKSPSKKSSFRNSNSVTPTGTFTKNQEVENLVVQIGTSNTMDPWILRDKQSMENSSNSPDSIKFYNVISCDDGHFEKKLTPQHYSDKLYRKVYHVTSRPYKSEGNEEHYVKHSDSHHGDDTDSIFTASKQQEGDADVFYIEPQSITKQMEEINADILAFEKEINLRYSTNSSNEIHDASGFCTKQTSRDFQDDDSSPTVDTSGYSSDHYKSPSHDHKKGKKDEDFSDVMQNQLNEANQTIQDLLAYLE